MLRPDGFVRVDDLVRALALLSEQSADPAEQMKRPKLKGLDFAGLESIVKEDKKGRYLMRREPEDGGEWWIRANQGHSVMVRQRCSSGDSS